MEVLLVNGDLEAARTGDRLALERVLVRSRQNLRRYAEFHCVINDIEDAVQESLLLVSRKLGDLRQLESFTSWLFRIIKRECNRLKRGRRLITGQDDLLADNPALARSVFNRFPYLEPLNHLQVELLRRYRSGDTDELVQRGILLTMSGLATALRNSG